MNEVLAHVLRHGPANTGAKPALASVYPPFADAIRRFREIAPHDPVAAAEVWKEVQTIAEAFWAGVDYACGAEE